jgi:aspartyl-tRNA(Asn)/glutamyl-tRNA(Gln) amidotransferase subunit A
LDNVESSFGPTRNPWNTERLSGGSSSGSAAATAAYLCAGSIGTDTAGSIRLPASFCGLAGHKPTYGLVSRYGVIPQAWSLDGIGPITRTAEDARLILQAIQGLDPKDETTRPPNTHSKRESLKGLVAGIPKEALADPIEADVKAAVTAAIQVMEKAGLKTREVSMSQFKESGTGMWATIGLSECAAYHDGFLPAKQGDYGADVKASLDKGRAVTAVEYLIANENRKRLRKEVVDLLNTVDLLLLPTAPASAPKMGALTVTMGGVETDIKGTFSAFTRLFNLTGHPALSIPCGLTKSELPVGLQIVARHWEDELALDVASLYQTMTDWHLRKPPLPPV